MRAVRIGLASALVGCAPEEEELDLPIDVCGQDEPVQILALEDELGTLEPGMRADLVVIDGDPLDVATLADRVESVYLDGTRVI